MLMGRYVTKCCIFSCLVIVVDASMIRKNDERMSDFFSEDSSFHFRLRWNETHSLIITFSYIRMCFISNHVLPTLITYRFGCETTKF